MDQLKQLASLMGQAGDFIAPSFTKSVRNTKGSIDLLKKMANKEEREKLQALSDEEKGKLFQGEIQKLKDRESAKAEINSFMLPASGTAASKGGRLAQRIGSNAAQASVQSLTDKEDGGVKELGLDTAMGTLFGTGAEYATKAAGKGLKAGAKMAFNTVFDEGKKGAENAVRKGAKSLGEEALKRGESGSGDQMFKKAGEKLVSAEKKLQDMLQTSDKTIDMNEVFKSIEPQIKKWQEAGSGDKAESLLKRLMDIADENGMQIPASKANELKRTLYGEADNAYGTEKATSIEGVKKLAKGIKDQIQNAVPEVEDINKELSYQGRIKDALLPQIGKEGRGKFLNALNVLTTAGGAVASVATGNPLPLLAPIISAAGSTPIALTTGGKALNKLGGSLDNGVIEKAMQSGGNKIGQLASSVFQTENPEGNSENNVNSGMPPEAGISNSGYSKNNIQQPNTNNNSHNDTTITQGNNNATANPNELVTITNDLTGETKQVKRSELSQYGVQDAQPAQQGGLPFTSEQLMQGIIQAQLAGDAPAQKELGKMLEVVSAYEEMQGKKQAADAKANKPKALTEKQLMYATAADNAQAALELLDTGKVKTGKGNIIPGAIGKLTGSQDDAQTEFEGYLAGATSAVISALSGANVPAAEFERIKASIPQTSDEPKIAKQKLKTFIQMAKKFTDADIATMQPQSSMDSTVNFGQLQSGY